MKSAFQTMSNCKKRTLILAAITSLLAATISQGASEYSFTCRDCGYHTEKVFGPTMLSYAVDLSCTNCKEFTRIGWQRGEKGPEEINQKGDRIGEFGKFTRLYSTLLKHYQTALEHACAEVRRAWWVPRHDQTDPSYRLIDALEMKSRKLFRCPRCKSPAPAIYEYPGGVVWCPGCGSENTETKTTGRLEID